MQITTMESSFDETSSRESLSFFMQREFGVQATKIRTLAGARRILSLLCYTEAEGLGAIVPCMARGFFKPPCVAVLGTVLVAVPVYAAPLPNSDRVLSYALVDQDLPGLLTGLAEQIGLRANISAKVQGRVHGHMPSSTAQATLDQLSGLYGFDWYCDGYTLYVSSFGEATSKILPLGAVSDDELLRTLNKLSVTDPRWPVRVSDTHDVIVVNGPPFYVALIDQTLAALAQRLKGGITEVHVFRGSVAGGQ
jgi:type II secretory pathway component GspD/PulD (secretin)